MTTADLGPLPPCRPPKDAPTGLYLVDIIEIVHGKSVTRKGYRRWIAERDQWATIDEVLTPEKAATRGWRFRGDA